VLADGSIIEATATNSHSDLFWALQAGGNSFCYATRFDIRTLVAPKVYVGMHFYGPSLSEPWLQATYNWAHYGSQQDPKSAIIPIVFYGSSVRHLGFPQPSPPIYTAFNFYNGNSSSPAALTNFTAPTLPAIGSTWAYRSLANFSLESQASQSTASKTRQRFYAQAFRADLDTMRAVHDIYMAAQQAQLANVTELLSVFTYNVLSKGFIRASNGARYGPGPQGIREDEVPLIWLEQNLAWSEPKDDGLMARFVGEVNARIDGELRRRGTGSKHVYFNEADEGQAGFGGYPEGNLRRMKAVRAMYDPHLVFTEQAPGGWKVEYA